MRLELRTLRSRMAGSSAGASQTPLLWALCQLTDTFQIKCNYFTGKKLYIYIHIFVYYMLHMCNIYIIHKLLINLKNTKPH